MRVFTSAGFSITTTCPALGMRWNSEPGIVKINLVDVLMGHDVTPPDISE